ncbi:phage tail tape measure protein, lambda family/phage tail tape measure protein, TP901 family, core region [Monaibacterium marinum]|uniref:Phage tail tape measure protein, lambda family/phage tail tape measure protein, TP901 family, core region n=1 Tax=Pontivivens marinum TaxID=1690039 RepID=A0A2C9CPT9_9RHOB|nr:phage tail tape measure protein [Monaibacterium marinum]SOH93376.1 phage tail tape measure protein, lambda family/phage tail tape measure protein, TP901 family, core region [Monaibacterium marinum]
MDERIRLILNGTDRGASRAVRTLRGELGGLRTVLGAGLGLGGAFAGVELVRGAATAIAGFGASMAQVRAITDPTEAEFAALTQTARELGGTTEFSASQAADGLRFLGMAGFDAAQSVAAIPAVLDLATAGALGLGDAADITSNIMSAFGIAAGDAGEAADVLAAASSRANTDIPQLGEAMSYVGPVAAAMNVSLADTAAAIGKLSDAGIQASSAGTGLRRILSTLVAPPKEASDAIAALGLELDDLDPNVVSITQIVDRFRGAGLDAADALTIFGDRGGPAILALVSQADGLRDLTQGMQDVSGEADRMASVMRDTLAGDVQTLHSAAEALALSLGEAGLGDALRSLTQGATDLIVGVTGLVDHLGQMNAAGDLTSVKIGLVFVGVAKLSSTLIGLAPVVMRATTALRAMGLASTFALGPVGAVITLVAAGAAVWLTFRDNTAEAETGMYDAVAGTEALNTALALFGDSHAPDAGRSAMDLAERNVALAQSSLDAAEAEYTLMEASLARERQEANALAAQSEPGAFQPLLSGASLVEETISGGERLLAAQEALVARGRRAVEEARAGLENARSLVFGQTTGDLGALFGLGGDGLLPPEPSSRPPADTPDSESRQPDEAEQRAERLAALMAQLTGQSRDAQAALTRVGLSRDAIEKAQRFDAAVRILTEAGVNLGDQWEDTGLTISEQIEAMINGTVDAEVEFEAMAERLQAVRDIGEQAMSGLADAIVGSARTGKLAIEDLVASGLEDLARLGIQRNVTGPLSDALFGDGGVASSFLSNLFGVGGGTGAKTVKSANGNVFEGGDVVAFATGGVVSGPTTFPMVGGNTGLMGEAGPEAIMPLTRLGNGKLGVQATGGGQGGNVTVEMPFTLQVIGGASEERVEMAPDGKSAQLFITGVVKEAFRTGTFRKELAQYGARKQPVGGA